MKLKSKTHCIVRETDRDANIYGGDEEGEEGGDGEMSYKITH